MFSHIQKNISLLLTGCVFLCGIQVYAAETTSSAQTLHHYTIIAPDTAKVGEAIDVTVEARDKDEKVITRHRGSIFFQSNTDYNATLPSQGRAIQFSESDNGSKKFSKGIVFKKAGEQTIEVSDTEEDIFGKKTIRVENSSSSTETKTGETITIITPENNSTLDATDFVTVSGYAKKNSKVNIKLNGTDIGTVISDENGLYTKTLPSVTQQSNILSVELLDGTNIVVGTNQIRFNITNTTPLFQKVILTPASAEVSSDVTVEINADPALSEVNISIDGSISTLKEGTAGKYTGKIKAPAKAGNYPITVTLKNSLSQGTTKQNAATLTVVEKKISEKIAKFSNVQVKAEGQKAILTFSVENAPTELKKFQIGYGTSSENLSETVTTKDESQIRVAGSSTGMSQSGSINTYSWYIDKLSGKSYTFKIFGVNGSGSTIAGLSSDTVSVTLGTTSCMIGNVGDITVNTHDSSSILSWKSVSGAISYNIYKIKPSGDIEFLKNTKETSYTLFLSSGSVVHEDFGVKALCDAKTESPDIAKVSKVQTGPGMLITLLVIAFSMGGLMLLRRKNA